MTKPEVSNEFIIESREHLQTLENSLLALEKTAEPDSIRQLIDEAFRVSHSLKGNAGFFGLTEIRELAHAVETALERYRSKPSQFEPLALQALLQANDRLRSMLDSIDAPRPFENQPLIEQLNNLGGIQSFNDSPGNKGHRFSVRSLQSIMGLIEFLSQQDSNCQVAPSISLNLTNPLSDQLPGADGALPLELAFNSRLTPTELQSALGKFADSVIAISKWIDISDEESVLSFFPDSEYSESVALKYQPVNLVEGLPRSPVLLSAASCGQIQMSPPLAKVETTSAAIIAEENRDIKASSPKPRIAQPSNEMARPSLVEPIAIVESSVPSQSAPTISSVEKPTSIRISVEILDRLMNLVGELTIVRNQSQATLGDGEDAARAVAQRLNSVTSELQDTVLKTRMQPVGNLFGRFPRMVRDLARQLGKQVEIQFQGQEVELDKSVLEQLSDPLTHLIRNSIDHGIELPDYRVVKGKPALGRIVVAARAGDGQVHIEIKDDGRGLDPNAIRAKLISSGLKSETELQKLSPRELASFILLPGFSTASKITDVSGRGVGMDVVKTNIERLEGSLNLDSEFGIGTTILLRVPLTLAIIPCLIVHVGSQRLAVPQRAIEEIVCIYPGGSSKIESTHNAEYLRLRKQLVPVVRMQEIMNCPKPFDEASRARIVAAHAQLQAEEEQLIQYVLVLNASGRRYGLLVEDVKGTEEVVVKPMHPSLKNISIFSGATVMGDGRIALITSAEGIATHAGCVSPQEVEKVASNFRDPAEVHRVLLFEFGPDERFALPLIQIRRVEAMKREQIEHIGQHQFVNIGGISTRLVFLDELLNVSKCRLGEDFHIIIPKFVVEPMGIVASRIVDTESMSIELQEASVSDPGILGTALIQGRLSVFLDIQHLRDKIFTSHLGETLQKKRLIEQEQDDTEPNQNISSNTSARVLLVDDTPFFREIVRRYLESQGMTIVTAVDGIDGLKKCAAEDFDLIVSDIEMPNMNGWEFCAAARKQGYDGPMIALTSLSKRENERQAKDCGFDSFEEKLDHDRLIKTVHRALKAGQSRTRANRQGAGQ